MSRTWHHFLTAHHQLLVNPWTWVAVAAIAVLLILIICGVIGALFSGGGGGYSHSQAVTRINADAASRIAAHNRAYDQLDADMQRAADQHRSRGQLGR